MTPQRLFVKENGRYSEVPNGPFPITREQLLEARAMFATERANTKPLHGAHHAPQTAARDILTKVAPQLSDFDRLMVGFAVTNDFIRIEDAT